MYYIFITFHLGISKINLLICLNLLLITFSILKDKYMYKVTEIFLSNRYFYDVHTKKYICHISTKYKIVKFPKIRVKLDAFSPMNNLHDSKKIN